MTSLEFIGIVIGAEPKREDVVYLLVTTCIDLAGNLQKRVDWGATEAGGCHNAKCLVAEQACEDIGPLFKASHVLNPKRDGANVGQLMFAELGDPDGVMLEEALHRVSPWSRDVYDDSSIANLRIAGAGAVWKDGPAIKGRIEEHYLNCLVLDKQEDVAPAA